MARFGSLSPRRRAACKLASTAALRASGLIDSAAPTFMPGSSAPTAPTRTLAPAYRLLLLEHWHQPIDISGGGLRLAAHKIKQSPEEAAAIGTQPVMLVFLRDPGPEPLGWSRPFPLARDGTT